MKTADTVLKCDPKSVRNMFDEIAPTYDLLNRLISFGLDTWWRKRAVTLLQEKKGGIFLDIAAGSGDVVFELLRIKPRYIVATDFSFNMMQVFQQKIKSHSLIPSLHLISCDAHNLPLQPAIFDGTIVAFGIRNFSDKYTALQEMFRVLKPGGIAVILELTRPKRMLIKQLYTLHTKILLPFVGKIISKHNTAYKYLPESIECFPEQDEFLELMRRVGFSAPDAHILSLGTATIFMGRKPL